MKILDEIQAQLSDQWKNYRQCVADTLQSDVELLNHITHYQQANRGKELRPLLVILSAEATQSRTAHTHQLAAAVELIHNASLMHDDIVDDDTIRRGVESLHSRWTPHIALLTGDYYFAKAVALLQESGQSQAIQIVTQAIVAMTESELLQQQLLARPTVTTDIDIYLNIIQGKTAALMQACSQLGCLQADHEQAKAMAQFGLMYGTAFQLHDDLLDQPDEQCPWVPEHAILQQMLDRYCRLAAESLASIPSNSATEALLSLVNQLL